MILYITRMKKQIKLETDFPRYEKIYDTTAVRKATKLFREEFNLKGKKLITYEHKDTVKKTSSPPPINNPVKTWVVTRALLYVMEDFLRYKNTVENNSTQLTKEQILNEARKYVKLSIQAETKGCNTIQTNNKIREAIKMAIENCEIYYYEKHRGPLTDEYIEKEIDKIINLTK